MLPRRVTSRIELVVSTSFVAEAGEAGYFLVGGDGDGVSVFMDSLGIQLLKRSCSLEMYVSFSWWMVAGAYLTAQERNLIA